MKNEKTYRTYGILLGILFYFVYISVIYVAGMFLPAEILTIKSPFGNWLTLGAIPVFVSAGIYYFEKTDFWEISGLITGFIIWLFIVALLQITQVNAYLSDGYVTTPAGFVFMIILYFAFKMKHGQNTGK
ncbi:hypothetical protein J2128_001512 [Methanomicrobium sp. W14]|uniref:hypothetical protein n=1 Tax=Methanomicrobium sp. W14 TaxID=2817839 RepID=UPI001AE69DE3|nr:hypothetical protein [Methanomicrobium sp. W14]MBP2133558.1 hypothetical protein [Methanomicrobium sp. W14]